VRQFAIWIARFIRQRLNRWAGILYRFQLGQIDALRWRGTVPKLRLAACEVCPFYNKSTTRCGKCGCFMYFKTRIPWARCPVGKW
jgi:hypothetical protein